MYKLKENKYGSTVISIGELEQKCIDHNKIPIDDDDGFVASFFFKYGDEEEGEEMLEDENSIDQDRKFRIFISTKRLLKIAIKSDTIHADATYKLN